MGRGTSEHRHRAQGAVVVETREVMSSERPSRLPRPRNPSPPCAEGRSWDRHRAAAVRPRLLPRPVLRGRRLLSHALRAGSIPSSRPLVEGPRNQAKYCLWRSVTFKKYFSQRKTFVEDGKPNTRPPNAQNATTTSLLTRVSHTRVNTYRRQLQGRGSPSWGERGHSHSVRITSFQYFFLRKYM